MVTIRRFAFSIMVCMLLLISGCGSGDLPKLLGSCGSGEPLDVQLVQIPNCSGTSPATLPNYDRLSEQFLDEETRHPANNTWGNIVWGTRYYMESLLTAYEATANPKYVQAFLDSGQWVLSLVQTMKVFNIPDPGQPVPPGTPTIAVTGWPTSLNGFGVPVPVPSSGGRVALYAQNLSAGAIYFKVAQNNDGTLQLSWTAGSTGDQVLQSAKVASMSDLNAVAAAPLVWGQSVGRIKVTGAGLPAPGVFLTNFVWEKTIWNSEQAAGILLPFVHFLLLAKRHPELVDETTQKEWTSKVLAIAAGYEDSFLPDGSGGLRQHNPPWLANVVADTDAAMDYISVEATFRLFLYELTLDPHQLAIAKGLISHQQNFHLSAGPQGWLLLLNWPDFVPWSSRAEAPAGSVWDSFQLDATAPSSDTDGGFFADFLHYAKIFKLCQAQNLYDAHRAAFQQYLLYGSAPINGSQPLLRASYPRASSRVSDPIYPSADPFSGAGFLTPEIANQSTVDANWNWMQRFAQDPQGQSIGYYLRAWARSEAAELNRCTYPKNSSP